MFRDNYLQLHPRWNCLNSFYFCGDRTKAFFPEQQIDDAVRQPMILHFEGSGQAKPWHFLNKHPFRNHYFSHLRATGWPAGVPEGINLRSLAIRFLPAKVQSPLRNVMRWLNGQHAYARCHTLKPELQVACAADARYAPYSGAMLHSLLAHNGGHSIHIHYLHPPEFPAALKKRLQRLAARGRATIRFHEIDDARVSGLPPLRGVPGVPWYRVFLPALLPELDRILYLDADTLVTGDLDQLWRMDLQGRPLGAVRNPIDPALDRRLAELGLAEGTPYFNSGVLLMNLRAWREARFTERVCEIARRNDRPLTWSDQDALNIAFHDNYLPLHPRWNCLNIFYFCRDWTKGIFTEQQVDDAVRQPMVVHFEGSGQAKPWNYFTQHPLRERYWTHLRASGLPVPRREDATLRNIVRRHTRWIPDPPRTQLLSFLTRTAALWSRSVPTPLAPRQ